jgi:hypothetical protein
MTYLLVIIYKMSKKKDSNGDDVQSDIILTGAKLGRRWCMYMCNRQRGAQVLTPTLAADGMMKYSSNELYTATTIGLSGHLPPKLTTQFPFPHSHSLCHVFHHINASASGRVDNISRDLLTDSVCASKSGYFETCTTGSVPLALTYWPTWGISVLWLDNRDNSLPLRDILWLGARA